MRNKTLTRIIIATLLCALLVNTGRATRVFALALPNNIVEPIYDTQIIDLQSYVDAIEESGGNPAVFYILLGLALVGYAGYSQYELDQPYDDPEDFLQWCENLGINFYNSVGRFSYTASGTLISPVLDYIHGCYEEYWDLKGRGVNDITTFIDYYNSNPDYSVQINDDFYPAMVRVYSPFGGLLSAQYSNDIPSSFTWYRYELTTTASTSYTSYLNSLTNPNLVNVTWDTRKNYAIDYDLIALFNEYHNLFINVSNRHFYFCNDSGQYISNTDTFYSLYARNASAVTKTGIHGLEADISFAATLTPQDVVYQIYNMILPTMKLRDTYQKYNMYISFPYLQGNNVEFDLYYGNSWDTRIPFEYTVDLNFLDSTQTFMFNPDTDIFINIRDLIGDLTTGVTDLYQYVLDNSYDLTTGDLILDTDLRKISNLLYDIMENVAPPIPVNLNEIAVYTENDYLEEVKERSRKFGETIGEYFVFWHNSDPVTVYVIFGSFIVVLVGAFIGKWGHS